MNIKLIIYFFCLLPFFNPVYAQDWGPRSLDIDFISWGGLHINTETLILPHPRLSERNFVLIPLAEVLSKSQGKPKRINSQNIWPE